MYVLFNVM